MSFLSTLGNYNILGCFIYQLPFSYYCLHVEGTVLAKDLSLSYVNVINDGDWNWKRDTDTLRSLYADFFWTWSRVRSSDCQLKLSKLSQL